MGLITQLKKAKKIYLDTNIYIAYFEQHEKAKVLPSLFSHWIDTQTEIAASPLLLTELLVYPYRHNLQFLIERYTHLDSFIPNFRWIPYDNDVATRAAQLQAQSSLRTPDSIHLASALENSSEIFLTYDRRIRENPDIFIVTLEQVAKSA